MQGLLLDLEALIFAAEAPLSREALHQCLEAYHQKEIALDALQAALEQLSQRYAREDSALALCELAGGYQFLTKPNFHPLLGLLIKQKSKKKLSKAALETLAVVAYQQPVTKAEIEQIRGVNCDYAIQKLLEKELIEIKGRASLAGRPLLYATSTKFMQHFGLNSVKDLPKLRELLPEDQQIGEEPQS